MLAEAFGGGGFTTGFAVTIGVAVVGFVVAVLVGVAAGGGGEAEGEGEGAGAVTAGSVAIDFAGGGAGRAAGAGSRRSATNATPAIATAKATHGMTDLFGAAVAAGFTDATAGRLGGTLGATLSRSSAA